MPHSRHCTRTPTIPNVRLKEFQSEYEHAAYLTIIAGDGETRALKNANGMKFQKLGHEKKRIEEALRENANEKKMKIEGYNLHEGPATSRSSIQRWRSSSSRRDARVSKVIHKCAQTKPLPPLPLHIVKKKDNIYHDYMNVMPQLSSCTKTGTPIKCRDFSRQPRSAPTPPPKD